MSRKIVLLLTVVMIFSWLIPDQRLVAGQTQTAEISKAKSEELKCDVQLDTKKPGTIIILLDLTQLTVVKWVTNLKVPVEFLDGHGKTLGTKQFTFVDADNHDSPLAAGQKYSRRFEYDDKELHPVAAVKARPANARIVTNVEAYRRSCKDPS